MLHLPPKIFFPLIFLCCSAQIFGQSHVLSGTVYDATTHEPLRNANIFNKAENKGTRTDSLGRLMRSVLVERGRAYLGRDGQGDGGCGGEQNCAGGFDGRNYASKMCGGTDRGRGGAGTEARLMEEAATALKELVTTGELNCHRWLSAIPGNLSIAIRITRRWS